MSKLGLVTAAALYATSCGRVPLDQPDVDTTPPMADAGADVTTSPPTTVTLAGTWSGQVAASAPGFSWGPVDLLTISFDASGALTALQFASNFPPPHVFGPQAPAFPLQGTRDTQLVPGSIYAVRVTVLAADFGSDHFHVRYRVVGLDGTPATDYVEDLGGHLVGDRLRVTYTADGTLLQLAIAARASGDLARS